MTTRSLCSLHLALFLLLFCSACSFQQQYAPDAGSDGTAHDDKAVQIWQRYAAKAAAAESMSGPFRLSANLRYTTTSGENARVSSLLWGNGASASPYPLRLDLLAGIGTVVAKIREDADTFIAFSPDEKIAYTHARDDRTLISFGVPIPLTLGDLALLLSGRSGRLFLPAGVHTDSGVPADHRLTPNGALYSTTGAPLSGVLELSDTGFPLSWREQRQGGWSLSMEPGEDNPLLPQKLSISHPGGYSALISVKAISRVSPPYTEAQMELELPPGTGIKMLKQE